MPKRTRWQTTTNRSDAYFRWIAMLLATLFAASLLAGCDEEVQRAISPGGVSDHTDDAAEQNDEGQGAVIESTDDASLAIGQRLLTAAERVYLAYGGDIWRIGPVGSPLPVVEDLEVVGFSANARGDRLALLHVERAGDDEDGEERRVLSIVQPESGARHDVTPIVEAAFDADLGQIESISSSPDGTALAFAYQSGAITVAGLDGTVRTVVGSRDGRSPATIRWSADGIFLLYLDPGLPAEPSELWIASTEQDLRQVLVDPESDTSGVVDAVWIPGTTKIAYVVASSGTIRHGGDLFLIDILSGERELLISAGQFAPVAGVVDIAISPGGDRLAFTAYVPGNPYPEFSGLWMIDLEKRSGIEIELDDGGTVTDLWWLGEDLLFRAIDEPRTSLPGTYTGLESFKIYEYNPMTRVLRERYDDRDEDDD
jgi:hypothetical protein